MDNFCFTALNTLPPCPDVGSQPLKSLKDFKCAFPYLFKPNRVAAIHPGEGGHPLKDRKSQWLFKLRFPEKDLPPNLIAKLPICVVVISRDGRFSLWQYTPDGDSSGLHPVLLTSHEDYLSPPDDAQAGITNYFYLFRANIPQKLSQRKPFYTFELIRVTQYVDSEGILLIKLLSPSFEYLLHLDFGDAYKKLGTPKPIRYQLYAVPRRSASTLMGEENQKNESYFRQIGGWRAEPVFLWDESLRNPKGALYRESARYGEKIHIEKHPGGRLWVAAEQNGFLVAGGGDSFLWCRKPGGTEFVDLNEDKRLRGYVCALELLNFPDYISRSPLILAGCDDYYIYILDNNGVVLQRLRMNAPIDGMICLEQGGSGKYRWWDIAILVRYHGIYCLRFYAACLPLDANKEGHNRKRFISKLEDFIADKQLLLKQWLDSGDDLEKLLAITLTIFNSSPKRAKLFTQARVAEWDDEINTYALHLLGRRLGKLSMPGYVSAGQRQQVLTYLQMLQAIAQGSFQARLGVRGLEGQLRLWREQATAGMYNDALETIDTILATIQDYTHKLRSLAPQLFDESGIKTQDKVKNILGIILSIDEFYRYGAIFSKIVLTPEGGEAQVDSLTFATGEPAYWIYARRNQEKLGSIYIKDEHDFLDVYYGGWENKLTFLDEPAPLDVRRLFPLDGMYLLVIAEYRIGVARQRKHNIDWYEGFDKSVWGADVRKIEDGFMLAVGGECLPGQAEAIDCFIIHGGEITACESPFCPDSAWNMRLRFSVLAWDSDGSLWAVTSGPGRLLHWPVGEKIPRTLATALNAQQSLLVLEDRVLCGSGDGVLRAFDKDGRLLWVNLFPGSVLGLTKNPSSKAGISDFAAITDKAHLFTYDKQGILQGIFQTPSVPVSLTAACIDQIPYYFFGSLQGGLRLVEEAPQNWKPADALIPPKNATESESRHWQIIRNAMEDKINAIARDRVQCREWCQIKAALQEPLRAAWAARCLLDNHPPDYDTIFGLLKEVETFKAKSGFSAQGGFSIRRLRAHLLGILGEHADIIPKNYHQSIVSLCKNVQDGALAVFILRSSEKLSQTNKLAHKILPVIWQKIHEGRPYTSAAILQRIRHQYSINSPISLDYFLRNALMQTEETLFYTGFVEGLLATLFQQLPEKSLLFALAKLPLKHTQLAEILCQEPDLRKRFCLWLDRYREVLFPQADGKLWAKLSEYLATQHADVHLLAHAIEHLQPDVDGKPKDVEALRAFLTLLPAAEKEIRRVDLPDLLQDYIEKTRQLREYLKLVRGHFTDAKKIPEQLNHCREIIKGERPKLALLSNLHRLWYIHWEQEIKEVEQTWAQLIKRQNPSTTELRLLEPIKRLFQAMQRLGFVDGRFFRLIRVLPEHRLLRLTYTEETVLLTQVPDIILSADQIAYMRRHQGKKTKKAKFLYNTHQEENVPWKTANLFSGPYTFPWVEIPLMRRVMHRNKFKLDTVGLFVFRWNYDDAQQSIEKQLAPSEIPLLEIMDEMRQALNLEIEEQKRLWYTRLGEAERTFFKLENSSRLEKRILETAMAICMAGEGLFLCQDAGELWLSVHRFEGTLANQRFTFNQVFAETLPLFMWGWKRGKPLYIADWQNSKLCQRLVQLQTPRSPLNQWLMHAGSVIVESLCFGDETLGFVVLQHPKPFHFERDQVEMLQALLDRAAWPLKGTRMKEEWSHEWEHAFVHEIRTELLPLIHAVDLLPPAIKNFSPWNQIKWHTERVYGLVDDFYILQQPGSVHKKVRAFSNIGDQLQELLGVYRAILQIKTKINIQPVLSDNIWSYSLKGPESAFTRVVRTLVDNAVKYTQLIEDKPPEIFVKARKSHKYWQLVITNPGQMSTEAYKLRFKAYKKPIDSQSKSAHVGLAASVRLANAYGGSISLENCADGRHVEAILSWPLAEKQENNA